MAVDKLVDSSQLNSDLTSVANAIRTKGGTSAALSFPAGFVAAIGDIPTGGSSPLVSGTFTGSASEKGSAKSITIPYTGSGYPVSVLIYPTEGGYESGSTIYNTAQNRAVVAYMAVKCDIESTPTYVNNVIQNNALSISVIKGSNSDATSYSTSSLYRTANTYYSSPSTGNNGGTIVRFYNSATNLSVYIAAYGGSEYGFLAGQEYTYQIIYSS